MVVFLTLLAVLQDVTAVSTLLNSVNSQNEAQPAASAANASADSAGDAGGAAITTAAPANTFKYVTYQPDKFYTEDFSSDSDNPLEELSYSATYPTSRPSSSSASEGSAASTATAKTSSEGSETPGAPKATEATKINSTNTSAVQIKQAPYTLPGCVTRNGEVGAWFTETAPEGTPCLFGVDDRDEGFTTRRGHCILDKGKFGSNGWCYTAPDASAWGSCVQNCPLQSSEAAVARKIDMLADKVGKLKNRLVALKATQPTQAVDLNVSAMVLLQQNETLLKRGQIQEDGPIEWIRSWLASDDLNASAQLAVSGSKKSKDSADSTAQGQVVAIPLQSQLLQETSHHAPHAKLELAPQKRRPEGAKGSGEVVKVKLQSQLVQKQKAPKSKGAVVSVKLQSQLLQKKSIAKPKKGGKTSLVHQNKKKKAAQQSNSSKSKRGVVVVKLQSQL